MRAFTVLSTLVAVAVSGVLATPDAHATLIARQATTIPDVPTQCQSACAKIQTISTCGADLSCMCTKEMGQGMVDCGNCGIEYSKNDPNMNTYKQQFQSAVNAFADGCKQAGHDIGTFSVTGSSSSGGSGGSGSSTTKPNGAASARTITGAGALVGVAVVMAMI